MVCAAPAATTGVSNTPMDFKLAPEIDALRPGVRAIVAGHVLALGGIYRYAHGARCGDGAVEVHKRVLSRHRVVRGGEFCVWG